MISYNDRHQAFIEEIRSGIKEFEANAAARCDMSADTDHDDLMAGVAAMVAGESEDKSKTWMERKSATIQSIGSAPREVQMIGLADKLSNMRDIDRDYPKVGEELWKRFRMKDKKMIGWYYKGVRDALAEDFQKEPVFQEYCRLIQKNFG